MFSNGRSSRLFCFGNRHAFARREVRVFDDDGQGHVLEIGQRLNHVRKTRVLGGGNTVALHKRFGEAFRTLELRCTFIRPENAQIRGLEGVHHARYERQFRPDHGEVDGVVTGKLEQRSVRQVGFETGCHLSDARVARRAVNLRHLGRAGERVDKSVFAPAPADDENVHAATSPNTTSPCKTRRMASG